MSSTRARAITACRLGWSLSVIVVQAISCTSADSPPVRDGGAMDDSGFDAQDTDATTRDAANDSYDDATNRDAEPIDAPCDADASTDASEDASPIDAGDGAADASAEDVFDSSTDGATDAALDADAADASSDASLDAGTDGSTTGGACSSNSDCAPTEYCYFLASTCGACIYSPPPCGTCVARPVTCSPAFHPCGCDGRLYCSHCSMARAGVNEAMAGRCSGYVGPCVP